MLKKLIGGFIVLVAIFVLVGMIVNANSPAAAQKSPAEQKQASKENANLRRAVVGAQSLRAAMRNPDSFKLASVHVKESGAVCYRYRAQNGFGGMNLENAVLSPGAPGLNPNASAWNAQCAHKNGEDLTDQVNYYLAHMGGQ